MIVEGAFVEKALSELIGVLTTQNPYGDGGASERIVKTLEEQSLDNLLK